MSNTFLFIIPLTPESNLTPLRKELQQLCFNTLLSQTYSNWKALLIGAFKPEGTKDNRFIHISEEGYKELKLQHAVKYIQETNLKSDYIVRLDDDDLINPSILKHYATSQADVIVDLYQWFVEWESKRVSKDFKPWFANTVLHKSEHALAEFGEIAREGVAQLNDFIPLIATNHALMHNYYKGKQIDFLDEEIPLYLRVINPDSITSKSVQSYQDYLQKFGLWKEKFPVDFIGLKAVGGTKKDIGKYRFSLKKWLYIKLSISKFKSDLKIGVDLMKNK